jgi:LPS O-antigen subunit length determinant protein (WzzB/FepE family)
MKIQKVVVFGSRGLSMNKNEEIFLFSIWKIVVKRKKLILYITILAMVIALFTTMSFRTAYEAEAILCLPRSEKVYKIDNLIKDERVLVNKVDTKNLLENLTREIYAQNQIGGVSAQLAMQVDKITIEPIISDENNIKITVRVYDKSEYAKEIYLNILDYLNTNKYVQNRFNVEKTKIEMSIIEIKNAIDLAMKTRTQYLEKPIKINSYQLNPLEIDRQISEFKTTQIELQHQLSSLHSYEYLGEPFIYKNKVNHKIFLSTIIFGMFGFFLSVFLSYLLELKKND